MKAVVTGATGFIGRALVEHLLQAGWQVSALARRESLDRLPAGIDRVIEADLGALHSGTSNPRGAGRGLRRALSGTDVLIHAGAIRNRWQASPADYYRVNVEGTRRLIEVASGRVRRFVYLSSVGVMGYPGVSGIDESFPVVPSRGKMDYHASKAAAEQLVLNAVAGFEPVVIRPTITYGPGDWDGALTRLALLLHRRRFWPVGSGKNHLHLTYITDLVSGVALAARQPSAAGRVFILAGPRSIPVRDLVSRLAQEVGCPDPAWRFSVPEILARPLAWGLEAAYRTRDHTTGNGAKNGQGKTAPPLSLDKLDILCRHRSFSDIKARRLLGYAPLVDYPEGIEKMLGWMASAGLLSSTLPAHQEQAVL